MKMTQVWSGGGGGALKKEQQHSKNEIKASLRLLVRNAAREKIIEWSDREVELKSRKFEGRFWKNHWSSPENLKAKQYHYRRPFMVPKKDNYGTLVSFGIPSNQVYRVRVLVRIKQTERYWRQSLIKHWVISPNKLVICRAVQRDIRTHSRYWVWTLKHKTIINDYIVFRGEIAEWDLISKTRPRSFGRPVSWSMFPNIKYPSSFCELSFDFVWNIRRFCVNYPSPLYETSFDYYVKHPSTRKPLRHGGHFHSQTLPLNYVFLTNAVRCSLTIESFQPQCAGVFLRGGSKRVR